MADGGGKMAEGLPKEVHVGAFLKSRIKELSGLSYVISSDVKHGKLASQQVPRHMRRRAVSHDVRRLPRRLRDKYASEKSKGGGNVPAAKRPSRKHRRRAGNLLQEYNRRQMKHFWMETHIWHAKRFHIANKWGCKIPDFPNDKCWRACYRATKTKALMFDQSYHNLVEIKARQSVLMAGLERLTFPETGKTFFPMWFGLEKVAVLRDRAGVVVGEVDYLWLPQEQEEEESDPYLRLWISCHPAFVKQVLSELKAVLGVIESAGQAHASADLADNALSSADQAHTSTDDAIESADSAMESADEKENSADPTTKLTACQGKASRANPNKSESASKRIKLENVPKKNVNLSKLSTRNVPAERAPLFKGPQSTQIIDFQGTINRFTIVGPNRFKVLRSVCVPACVESTQSSPSDDQEKLTWWKSFYSNPENLQNFVADKSAFLANPDEVTRNISLTVRDPRLLLPIKKFPDDKEIKSKKEIEEFSEAKATNGCHVSAAEDGESSQAWTKAPFFSSQIRDSVSLSKCSDVEINKKRSQSLIPGTKINLGEEESRIPVVILPQENSLSLLVPAGWGMSFWMCLVFHGCRVGGYRELQHQQLEQGNVPLLVKYPESEAFHEESESTAEKLKSTHFALPPNKRVNFAKLGIASPFEPPLRILVADWLSDSAIEKKKSANDGGDQSLLRVLRDEAVLEKIRRGDFSDVESFRDHLVTVKLKVEGRGKLGLNTLLCVPSEDDLSRQGPWEGPVEPQQEDTMEQERKRAREQHQNNKKRLKRQWKKLKDKQMLMKTQATALGQPLDTAKLDLVTENMKTVKKIRNNENDQFGAKTEDFWIGDFNSVRHSCRREVIGYLTAANMAYTVGAFVGFGFITLRGLQKLQEVANKPNNLVLTRETSSLQYRFSSLTIL